MRHDVILYTREGCHLCDDAHELLVRFGLRPRLVDIDEDPRLRERYHTLVPVVAIDGRERFRGRVNEVLLRRLLVARPQFDSDTNSRGERSEPPRKGEPS
ncbi:MAG TPA: glutaredoxin family protein [Pirellulaceae bacterium]|nr:glutaredoxin family protein [Pirellulaceae bacterium]